MSFAASNAIAGVWGFLDATVFFVAPDVFLTRLALRNLRQALVACLWATLGALVGGAGVWAAAHQGRAPALLHTYLWLPGINNNVIAGSGQAVQREGASALLKGAATGRPYKLYAVHAGAQDVPLGRFLLISALVRAGHFALSTLVAWAAGRVLTRMPEAIRYRLHGLFWVAFYAVYFVVMR